MTALKSILNTDTNKIKDLFERYLRKETIEKLIWRKGHIFTMIKIESENLAEINLFNSIRIS